MPARTWTLLQITGNSVFKTLVKTPGDLYLYFTDANTVAQHADYNIDLQDKPDIMPINYNSQGQFCARGHLTPNGDFSDPVERERTYVTTNIAPQWQPFNGGNWAVLEKNIRTCATLTSNNLFVFTGTSK